MNKTSVSVVVFKLLAMLIVLSVNSVQSAVISGQWIQGGVLRGQLEQGEFGVSFLGHQVPISANGSFVIGLGRDAPKQVELIVEKEGDLKEKLLFEVAQRDYKIQRIEGVPNRTVNPAPGHYERIRNEVLLAKQARAKRLETQDYEQTFIWPVTGRISGVYGSQRFYNGQARRPHFGVDIARPTGTPIIAPAGGTVTLAHPDMFFSGGTIILDHGHGLSSSFLHLSKLLVEEGQRVEQGDVIAEIGATGRVTGPHLDWRMNWFDQRVDPTTLVPPMAEVLEKERALGASSLTAPSGSN